MNIEKKKTSPALFVRQVKQELSKVIWPTRRDTLISAGVVIFLILLFSLFFLMTDWVLSKVIKMIISFGAGL